MKTAITLLILFAVAISTGCEKNMQVPVEDFTMPVISEDSPPGATNAVLFLEIRESQPTDSTSSLRLKAASPPARAVSRSEAYNYGYEVKLIEIDAEGFHVRFNYTNYLASRILPLSSNVVFKYGQEIKTNLFGLEISGELK